MTAKLSLWALPSMDAESPYAEEIARLAEAAPSRPFPPHVTVLSIDGDADEAGASITDVASHAAAFSVELTALEDSDDRFRCITLAIGDAGPLQGLRDALAPRLGASPGSYSPHLSLLYGEFDEPARSRLKRLVKVALPRPLVIDRVQLVDTGDDDFTRWPVVQTWELADGRTPA